MSEHAQHRAGDDAHDPDDPEDVPHAAQADDSAEPDGQVPTEPVEPAHGGGEPVLTRASYVRAVTVALPAAYGLAAAAGVHIAVPQDDLLAALLGCAGLVVAAAHWGIVTRSAHAVRALVTPLLSPRSASGEQLVALSVARDMAAHAAARAAQSGTADVLPIGKPRPTPWAEDSTVIEDAA